MKLQLDTENKTITIEEDVNLHEFYEQINSILPGGLWREFTLKVGKIREWNNPITITPYTPINPFAPIDPNPSPYTNPYPTYPHIWYTTSNSDNDTLITGIYNITTKA
jgi:hypothetical protein